MLSSRSERSERRDLRLVSGAVALPNPLFSGDKEHLTIENTEDSVLLGVFLTNAYHNISAGAYALAPGCSALEDG